MRSSVVNSGSVPLFLHRPILTSQHERAHRSYLRIPDQRPVSLSAWSSTFWVASEADLKRISDALCGGVRQTDAVDSREIEQFERDGYVAVRGAVDPDVTAACRAAIWEALASQGVTRDQATWTRPVVRVPCPESGPFDAAGTAPALRSAYDALIGPGRWAGRRGVGGSVPVRFPSEEYPGDVGWHIEGSYEVNGGYWANVRSRARGLLALILFSDVGEDDAPTRMAIGSHLAMPSILEPAGETGMSGDESISHVRPSVMCRTVVHAVGRAGDVFLCHPFIVHTATWPHRGTTPRMMAQPGIYVEDGFAIDGSDASPVARAIVAGLNTGGA
jgi:hypothetical protein